VALRGRAGLGVAVVVSCSPRFGGEHPPARRGYHRIRDYPLRRWDSVPPAVLGSSPCTKLQGLRIERIGHLDPTEIVGVRGKGGVAEAWMVKNWLSKMKFL
jgi:hypothetical protein